MIRYSIFIAGLRELIGHVFQAKKKRLITLRNMWGYELRIERKFDLISKFHDLTGTEQAKEMVDDKTWYDLNMDEVFAKIDRNVSAIGRQYLYRLLRTYENNEASLAGRYEQYNIFKNDQTLRESIQLPLFRLSHENASFISHLIFDDLPVKPKLFYLIYLSSFISISSLFLMFFIGQFFFVVLLFSLINFIIHGVYSKKIYEHFEGLYYLNTMLGVASELSSIKSGLDLPQLGFLRENRASVARLRKKIGWLVIDKSRLIEVASLTIEYLNLICLFDIIAFIRSIDKLERSRQVLAEIFEAISSLDAFISIASYSAGLPFYTCPKVSSVGKIEVTKIYHPLLNDPVPNSFQLIDKSGLITGSNMAGKTTFIKTIGVNILFSRTLYICLAEKADLPPVIIKSSINREEKIEEGKSYFFLEVEELLKLIRLSHGEKRYLFLIDEIYRGTNTLERVAAATAVLNYLGRENIVLATTHDIELKDLLDEKFSMFHFSEQVSGDIYYFDYLIKDGPCKSRNAIKLLELSGYPEMVTNAAHSLAGKLTKKLGRV